jgi:hypothetical protein
VIDACYLAKTCKKGPFPLLTWSDTHQLFGTTPIFELMLNAVQNGYMPFQVTDITPPVAPLGDAEKATLINWAKACAPAGTRACGFGDGGGGTPVDGAAGGDK